MHNTGAAVPVYHYVIYCICSDIMLAHTVLWFCMVFPAGVAYGNRFIGSYAVNM